MATQLFHLEGPSLEELKVQASALYGPRALIVSAELVTVGGIRGMFARQHYEIVVEVPGELPAAPSRARGRRSTGTEPTGIKALLEQAELDEVRLTGTSGPVPDTSRGAVPPAPGGSAVSTTSGLFEALMDNLATATDAERNATPAKRPPRRSTQEVFDAVPLPPQRVPRAETADDAVGQDALPYLPLGVADPAELPPVTGRVLGVPPRLPEVLSAPGDLVVVVGAPATSWEITASMATALGTGTSAAAALAGPPSWCAPGAQRVRDRREALALRASGVDGGHAVFVSLASADPSADTREMLALRPDQVWIAVDAGRKETDTAAWVGALRRSMDLAGLVPAGLAVVGSAGTSTPGTVLALGLPIGWADGRAAVAPGAPRRSGPGRRRAGSAGIE